MELRHTKPLKTARPTGRTVLRRVKPSRPNQDVEFSLDEPKAYRVSVAGSFNAWDPEQTPLSKDAKGKWTTTVSLPPGRYEYRFVVDGHRWLSDPEARESIPNDFGSTNSVLVVG